MDKKYCVHCGQKYKKKLGLQECPVSRFCYRIGSKSVLDAKKGEVHGQAHLWSAGHVESWFNYSGQRGKEQGWENVTDG